MAAVTACLSVTENNRSFSNDFQAIRVDKSSVAYDTRWLHIEAVREPNGAYRISLRFIIYSSLQ